MSDNSSSHKHSSAFTIVELLIVIVIIAILATITIVGFTGIQKRAVASTLQDTLKKAATALEATAVDTSTYATLPTSITLAEGIGIALTEPVSPATTATTYCINATTQKYDDVTYYIEKGKSPEKGLCEGEVLTTSGAVMGDYNYSAGGAEDLGYTPITIGSAHNDLYNFTVKTNIEWTQVTLSWDAQLSTGKYEIQVRTSTTGAWNYVVKSNGYPQGATCQVNSLVTCTGIAPPATQISWAATTSTLPTSAGQTFQYRIRNCANSTASSDSCGEWSAVSLASPIQENARIPGVSGFAVTPSSEWTSVSLSWDASPRYTAFVTNARYQIQVRTSTTGTWNYVAKSSGYPQGAACQVNSLVTCTGIVPPATQISWAATTSTLPTSAGQTFQYRIRNCADESSTYCGEWSTVSLTRP